MAVGTMTLLDLERTEMLPGLCVEMVGITSLAARRSFRSVTAARRSSMARLVLSLSSFKEYSNCSTRCCLSHELIDIRSNCLGHLMLVGV